NSGQLGQGNTSAIGDQPDEVKNIPFINLGTNGTATKMALGFAHSCALLAGGKVKCWGANNRGQLGLDDATKRADRSGQMVPALKPVALGGTATDIAAGSQHTCAIITPGNVKCWGDNSLGELGQGNVNTLGDGPGEMEKLAVVSLGATATSIEAGNGF